MPITAENFGELQFTSNLPPQLMEYGIPGAEYRVASGPFGQILIQQFQVNGFTLVYESYFLNRFTTFFHNEERSSLHLRLQVNNSLRCQVGHLPPVLFHERAYNISYMPVVQKRMHCRKEGVYSLVELHFNTDHLEQLSPMFPALASFLEKVQQLKPAMLISVNQLATPKMMSITREMLYSGYTGPILHTYLAAKCRELLVTCLERIMNNPQTEPLKIAEKEIERVYEARDIILNNLVVEYTMQEMSRLVGLSQYKLKYGFLILFGTSIAGYQRDARMEKARLLLQDDMLKLQVVAEMVGFTNVNSFSLSYKNYFGVSPAERLM